MAWTRIFLGLIASAAIAHGAAAQQKPDKIVIGYLNLVNAQLVTKALGLHEKEIGVPIEWVKFGSGGDVNRAVAASQLSFGGVGNPPATIGAGRGLGYKGIFVLNMLGPVESLAVRTSKGIEKPQDLVGKTMAAPFGSTTHYLTIAYLRSAGVDPTTVKLLDMSPSDAAAAWIRGDIDAAYIWEPSLNKLLQNGGKILMDSGTMAARGFPTWDISVVMDDFAAKYPEIVTKFVKSECAARGLLAEESRGDRRHHRQGAQPAGRRRPPDDEGHRGRPMRQAAHRDLSRHIQGEGQVRRHAGRDGDLPRPTRSGCPRSSRARPTRGSSCRNISRP